VKKLSVWALALVFALGLVACDWFAPPEPTSTTTTELQLTGTAPDITTEPQSLPAVLYLPNDNADGFIARAVLCDGTAADLVARLVGAQALPEGCALLSFENGVADMNAAFGQAIGTTGTTGEYLRIGCVVNTLLTFYGLESIYITVEGAVPVTGHNEYDFPLRFFENQQGS